METLHHVLYLLCGVLDMIAAFQAMVSAHYKLALMGFGALVLLVVVGFILYYCEGKRD